MICHDCILAIRLPGKNLPSLVLRVSGPRSQSHELRGGMNVEEYDVAMGGDSKAGNFPMAQAVRSSAATTAGWNSACGSAMKTASWKSSARRIPKRPLQTINDRSRRADRTSR